MAYDAIIQRLIFLTFCVVYFQFLLYILADSVLGIQICNLLFIYLVLYHQLSHLVKKLHKHHFEKLVYLLTQKHFI